MHISEKEENSQKTSPRSGEEEAAAQLGRDHRDPCSALKRNILHPHRTLGLTVGYSRASV